MSLYVTKNFKYAEIRCPCCGKDRPVEGHSIYLLQNLRDYINQPICISKGGGIRCLAYNKSINGYWNSAHLFGKAWDISSYGISLIQLAKFAKEVGFSRIGIYPNDGHIHIDTFRPTPSKAWVKFKGRDYMYFNKLEEAMQYVALFMV